MHVHEMRNKCCWINKIDVRLKIDKVRVRIFYQNCVEGGCDHILYNMQIKLATSRATMSTRIGLKFGFNNIFVLNYHDIVLTYSFACDAERVDKNLRHSYLLHTEAVEQTELHKLSFETLSNQQQMLEDVTYLQPGL